MFRIVVAMLLVMLVTFVYTKHAKRGYSLEGFRYFTLQSNIIIILHFKPQIHSSRSDPSFALH